MAKRKHFLFEEIEEYLRNKVYPSNIAAKDYCSKSNFRRTTRKYSFKDGHLFYKERIVRNHQMEIITDVHSGTGNSEHYKEIASHRGKNSTHEKIAQILFWYNISNDISDLVKKCEQCQKQGDLKSPKADLKPIPILSTMMKQMGVDVCNLSETDGYCHVIVLIDYFSKWSEEKPTKDKSAPTVAQFLYELMCHNGCFDVQINDQGRKFVNQVCEELHKLTGVEQRMTYAYHPQANGLVERQNRTIKNSLVKVLEDNHEMWPHIIERILFAHRVSRHSLTKYSFMRLYKREPVLPIDVKHNLDREKKGEIESGNQEPFYL